jgi:dihydrofolate reductase
MRPRCSVFVATSLDGFISREDGRIDWLEAANATVPAGEDCGYAAFFATVDALVMGRGTFETALAFPEWPYGAKPVFVVSRTLTQLPESTPATVSLSDEPPTELVARLHAEGFRHLYVDGGRTIQAFLSAGLIDELTITVIPVLLGAGRPLFGPLWADVALELVASRSYPFGFVQNRYRVRVGG